MPSAAVQVAPELAEAVAARQAQWAQQGAAPAAAGQQQDGQGAPGEAYLVPACAAWFRWDAIADVEEAHFRDFLAADAANPERYREYRNAIINKYRCVLLLGYCAWVLRRGSSLGRWTGRECYRVPAGHSPVSCKQLLGLATSNICPSSHMLPAARMRGVC